MKKTGKILKIITSLAFFLPTLFLFPISKAYAFSVSDGIKEFNLNPGDFDLGTVEFKNTQDKPVEIKVETKAYDPKGETFLSTSPFVGINKSTYNVKAQETINIDYAVSIPQNQPEGSFFNVLTIEPVTKTSDSSSVSVSIKNGFGVLFAFHITKPGSTIDKIFIDNSDTKLIIENKGLPFIFPMTIKYLYENKSEFVFKPQGEIRLMNNNGKQVAERFSINEEQNSIYPGEKLEISKDINAWDDLKEVLNSKLLISRTYNGFTNNYLTNQVEVSIKEPIIMTGVLAGVIVLALLSGVISVIRKLSERNSKSEE